MTFPTGRSIGASLGVTLGTISGRRGPSGAASIARPNGTGHPQHVAIVMDGNGRWATSRGLPRIAGHAAGERALVDVVGAAISAGVSWLTLFAFSTENWNRPRAEVDYLMEYNRGVLVRRRDGFHEMGVRIRVIGNRDDPVPSEFRSEIEEAETLTARNRGLNLTIAFNYGGRAAILEATHELLTSAAGQGLDIPGVQSAFTEDQRYFLPDVDLLIRTGGERRLSNFLLWESAYAELYFTGTLWPDFGRSDFDAALVDFRSRSRRFGSVHESSEPDPEFAS